MANKENKIIFLVGPTAVGKTEFAISLAKKINGEIISCDSMQIYKKMDIITSKPSRSLRKQIPHYLIDFVSPTREYNVSRYRKQAIQNIKEILKKDKIPIFVGGTGLYVSMLIDGIFTAKAENKKIRNKLYLEAEKLGSNYLYQRLKKIDSLSAAKIHPHDTRRIVRAIEVFETTGKPISWLQKQRHGLWLEFDVRIFCLNMPREALYQRIDRRVEKMFRQGLLKEVKKLLKLKLSRTAACAIGIKELKPYLEGVYDLAQGKRLMKRNSRQYAKRQLTWFRKDRRVKWITISGQEKPREVVGRIVRNLDKRDRCPIGFVDGARTN